MKFLLSIILGLTLSMPAFSQHEVWNDLLQTHVSEDGKVDYKGFLSDKDKLDEYLSSLSNFPWDRVRMTREGEMAFWINAYNAFTVKLITNNYPIESITLLNDGYRNPWDQEFILMKGAYMSLNTIEHEILRAKYKDARIHFAINCASVSCPRLMNVAFTPENLEVLLEQGAVEYINNPLENKISPVKAELSQLFQWFASDFVEAKGSVKDFINAYSRVKLSDKAVVDYKEYDWSLNE